MIVLTTLFPLFAADLDPDCSRGLLSGTACCPSSCIRCDDETQCPRNLAAATAPGSPCCPSVINTSGRFCSSFKPPCTLDETGPIAQDVPDLCVATNPKNAAWCFCYLTLTNKIRVSESRFFRDWCLSMKTRQGFIDEKFVCEDFGLGSRLDIDRFRQDILPIVNQKVVQCGGCPRAQI